jgi:hypothetical protein
MPVPYSPLPAIPSRRHLERQYFGLKDVTGRPLRKLSPEELELQRQKQLHVAIVERTERQSVLAARGRTLRIAAQRAKSKRQAERKHEREEAAKAKEDMLLQIRQRAKDLKQRALSDAEEQWEQGEKFWWRDPSSLPSARTDATFDDEGSPAIRQAQVSIVLPDNRPQADKQQKRAVGAVEDNTWEQRRAKTAQWVAAEKKYEWKGVKPWLDKQITDLSMEQERRLQQKTHRYRGIFPGLVKSFQEQKGSSLGAGMGMSMGGGGMESGKYTHNDSPPSKQRLQPLQRDREDSTDISAHGSDAMHITTSISQPVLVTVDVGMQSMALLPRLGQDESVESGLGRAAVRIRAPLGSPVGGRNVARDLRAEWAQVGRRQHTREGGQSPIEFPSLR